MDNLGFVLSRAGELSLELLKATVVRAQQKGSVSLRRRFPPFSSTHSPESSLHIDGEVPRNPFHTESPGSQCRNAANTLNHTKIKKRKAYNGNIFHHEE